MAEFPIPKDGYLNLDSASLKEHIKNSLNAAGVMTDQNYEGSYISTVIDIVAYTFNVLMFYLNKTSSESMFTDAQIYENMNRIVKMLDYKPIGDQTSTLSFLASADTYPAGLYTIPRYSYLSVNGIKYSFNEDITFQKSISGDENLTNLSDQKLLYQGTYVEYPIYTAIGQENEIVFLTPGDNIVIDHFNIDVYVKDSTGRWKQWERTPSLYLENANSYKYEVRFNENQHYELKFGNDINGKKLSEGDQVAIYYLESDGQKGEIGVGALRGIPLNQYTTVQFDVIFSDVASSEFTILPDFSILSFDNNSISTYSSTVESVDSIRQNAPGIFRSQYRLVTSSDYENYVKTNFANLIHDVKVVNNWGYLSEYLKYYYDIGLEKPSMIARPLYNQVQFADGCNFNNVYIIAVPKTVANIDNPAINLAPAQKELMISSMRSEKTLTAETIIIDPIYVAVGLSVGSKIIDIADTELLIVKQTNSRRDSSSIINDVKNVFINYFDKTNTYLGQVINLDELGKNILAVNGVKTFFTRRKSDPQDYYEGLSMLIWNPIYSNLDLTLTVKNVTLPYFKYPYLFNAKTFDQYITVQSDQRIFEGIEF